MKSLVNLIILFLISVCATNLCLAAGYDFWPIIGVNILIGGLLGAIFH
jgi:hypothetical protein